MQTEDNNDDLKIGEKSEDYSRIEIDKIFDTGILACDQKNTLEVCKVLKSLKGMIDLQYKEAESGFHRLYDFCFQFVNDKEFGKAREILFELRQSWNVVVVTSPNNTQGVDI